MTTVPPNPSQPPTASGAPLTTAQVNEALRFEPQVRLGRQAEGREDQQVKSAELIEQLAEVSYGWLSNGQRDWQDAEKASKQNYRAVIATDFMPLIVSFVAEWMAENADNRLSEENLDAVWREAMQP